MDTTSPPQRYEHGEPARQSGASLAFALQLFGALIGAVAGTVLSSRLGSSPTDRLVGAFAGAALPIVATVAGPWHRGRIALSIVATIAGLVLLYTGATAIDYAQKRPETFPLPSALPPTQGEQSEEEDGVGITVSPPTLSCDDDGCESTVTIESSGDKTLELTTMEVRGDARDDFRPDGRCQQIELAPGDACEFGVDFATSVPGAVRTAELVIHQNVGADPTLVPLEGEADEVPGGQGDLSLAPAEELCTYQPGGLPDGSDALQVFVRIQAAGVPAGSVRVGASSDTGSSGSVVAGIGQIGVPLGVGPEDSGTTPVVTVTVDPDDAVAETSEDNNTLRVRAQMPAVPGPGAAVPCQVV